MKTAEEDVCQSCGMPMESAQHHGTNMYGGKKDEYCRFCYKDGGFTDEGITMEQKIAKNIEIATKRGIPAEKAREMANKVIPRLGRWKKLKAS